jgi:hypothetical protein
MGTITRARGAAEAGNTTGVATAVLALLSAGTLAALGLVSASGIVGGPAVGSLSPGADALSPPAAVVVTAPPAAAGPSAAPSTPRSGSRRSGGSDGVFSSTQIAPDLADVVTVASAGGTADVSTSANGRGGDRDGGNGNGNGGTGPGTPVTPVVPPVDVPVVTPAVVAAPTLAAVPVAAPEPTPVLVLGDKVGRAPRSDGENRREARPNRLREAKVEQYQPDAPEPAVDATPQRRAAATPVVEVQAPEARSQHRRDRHERGRSDDARRERPQTPAYVPSRPDRGEHRSDAGSRPGRGDRSRQGDRSPVAPVAPVAPVPAPTVAPAPAPVVPDPFGRDRGSDGDRGRDYGRGGDDHGDGGDRGRDHGRGSGRY